AIRLNNSGSASLGFVIGHTTTGTNILNYENTPIYFGTNGMNKMVITAAGNVGIGTTTSAPNLLSVGNAASDAQIMTARIYATGTGTGWFGNLAVGGTTAAAVMGQLYNRATIGGHSSDLSTWTDLAINPIGGNVGI